MSWIITIAFGAGLIAGIAGDLIGWLARKYGWQTWQLVTISTLVGTVLFLLCQEGLQ